MKNLIRLLPIFFIMLLLDYAYFNMIIAKLDVAIGSIGRMAFWIIPIAALFVLLLFPRRSQEAIHEPYRRDSHAAILGIYISKFLGLAMVALSTILFGAGLGIGKIFGWASAGYETYAPFLGSLGLVLSLLLFTALVWGMLFNRYRYKVHEVKVAIANLPKALEGFTLVQLSDIHSGSFTNPNLLSKGIAKINSLNPDLFCFTGDLVNNRSEEILPYVDEFKKIKAKFGQFAILGNHDYGDYVQWGNLEHKKANLQKLVQIHEALGWDLLRDDAIELEIDNAKISLLGVENISAKGRFKNYGDLTTAYQKSTKADLKILMSHDPSHWKAEVLNYEDIHLCLSGHTHGMQFGIEWGKLFKWSPVKYVYKEWAGLYQEGQQFLYVNRGYGFLGYPGRVGIRPEITRIEFTKGQR